MKRLIVLAAAAMLAFGSNAMADDVDVLLAQIADAQKKLLILKNLDMTEAEKEKFWPIYEEYHGERVALNQRYATMIEEFARVYTVMTDQDADRLVREHLAVEEARNKLEKKYLKRFESALPAVKVMRYYQLENKLLAVARAQLAAGIPFAE